MEVKSRTRSRDCDIGRTSGTHDDMEEYSRSVQTDRPKAQVSTSIVQRLTSKFESKQKGTQVPIVQRVQKTVEEPRVHENKKRKTLFVSIASGDEAEDGNRERVSDDPMSRPGRRIQVDGRDRRARPRTRDSQSDACRVGPRLSRREERVDASPRICWSSGPQRKVHRNQGGNCGQKTGQNGARTTRSC